MAGDEKLTDVEGKVTHETERGITICGRRDSAR
jgi:hypothetical protein